MNLIKPNTKKTNTNPIPIKINIFVIATNVPASVGLSPSIGLVKGSGSVQSLPGFGSVSPAA
jgi:hypothetical protein